MADTHSYGQLGTTNQQPLQPKYTNLTQALFCPIHTHTHSQTQKNDGMFHWKPLICTHLNQTKYSSLNQSLHDVGMSSPLYGWLAIRNQWRTHINSTKYSSSNRYKLCPVHFPGPTQQRDGTSRTWLAHTLIAVEEPMAKYSNFKAILALSCTILHCRSHTIVRWCWWYV